VAVSLDDEGLQLRNLIRLRLQDVAEQLPGAVGFVIPIVSISSSSVRPTPA
jgi:hypothetical protein